MILINVMYNLDKNQVLFSHYTCKLKLLLCVLADLAMSTMRILISMLGYRFSLSMGIMMILLEWYSVKPYVYLKSCSNNMSILS